MPISFTMPAAPPVSAPPLADAKRLAGRDVRFDSSAGYTVGANGDYTTVDGDAATRQSVLLEAMTSPGELASVPDYGFGLAAAVRKAATKSVRDEVANRARERLRRNKRVEQVLDVATVADDTGLLRLEVSVTSAGKALSTSVVQEPRR